jgi:hypothetical protein
MNTVKHIALVAAAASLSACMSGDDSTDTAVSAVVGTWQDFGPGSATDVVAMTATNNTLYAATSTGRLERHALPVGTAPWVDLGGVFLNVLGRPTPRILALAASSTKLYAATDTNNLYSATLTCLATTAPYNCWTSMGTGPYSALNPIVGLAYLNGSGDNVFAVTQTADGQNLWNCTVASCTGHWSHAFYANGVGSMAADPTTTRLYAVGATGGLWSKAPTAVDWTSLAPSGAFVGMGINGAGGNATLYVATPTIRRITQVDTLGSLRALPLCNVAATCAARGANCGTITDPVCGAITCGGCAAGQTCTTASVCCTPTTCAARGATCGTISNGCGGSLNCGSCGGATPTCSSANVCVCVPTTAACAGRNCGTAVNNCGQTISCGTCGSGQTCGGGGTANVCGSPCVRRTCAAGSCGLFLDGCGHTMNCGPTYTCHAICVYSETYSAEYVGTACSTSLAYAFAHAQDTACAMTDIGCTAN